MVTRPCCRDPASCIIAAAAEIFEQRGYGNTSLSDVIEHAQVTRGAFYYHFATREELRPRSSSKPTTPSEPPWTPSSPPPPMLERSSSGPVRRRGDDATRPTDSGGYALRMPRTVTLAEGAVLEQRRPPSSAQQRPQSPRGTPQERHRPRGNHTRSGASVTGTQVMAAASNDKHRHPPRPNMANHPGRNVPPASLPYFTQFLARVEKQYAQDPWTLDELAGVHPGAEG